ncbi:protein AMN1 homolog isoform X2 [Pyxicephalus adspersus]
MTIMQCTEISFRILKCYCAMLFLKHPCHPPENAQPFQTVCGDNTLLILSDESEVGASTSQMTGAIADKVLRPVNSATTMENNMSLDTVTPDIRSSEHRKGLKENAAPAIIDLTTPTTTKLDQEFERPKALKKRKIYLSDVPRSRTKKTQMNDVSTPVRNAQIMKNTGQISVSVAANSAGGSRLNENSTGPVINCPNAPKRRESFKNWQSGVTNKQRSRSRRSEPLSPISEIIDQKQRSSQDGETACIINNTSGFYQTPCSSTNTPVIGTGPLNRRITFNTPEDHHLHGRTQQTRVSNGSHEPLINNCSSCWDENTYGALSSLGRCNDKMLRVANFLKCCVRDSMLLAFNSPSKIKARQIHNAHEKYKKLIRHLDAIEKEMAPKI